MKKAGLKGSAKFLAVYFNPIDTNNILHIQKYLMEKHNIKQLLINGSNHTKCMSLSNQKCMTQPTLINFHPNE